jgi:hypothetical protein
MGLGLGTYLGFWGGRRGCGFFVLGWLRGRTTGSLHCFSRRSTNLLDWAGLAGFLGQDFDTTSPIIIIYTSIIIFIPV